MRWIGLWRSIRRAGIRFDSEGTAVRSVAGVGRVVTILGYASIAFCDVFDGSLCAGCGDGDGEGAGVFWLPG